MRTQVGIVGAGPAGLTLAQLLARARDRVRRPRGPQPRVRRAPHPRRRARAGHGRPADGTPASASACEREGQVHHGISLQFDGERHRLPLSELAEGRSIVVYGQTEVVKDLIAARLDAGLPLLFEVVGRERARADHRAAAHPLHPRGARRSELDATSIAGCDGYHGICREASPAASLSRFDATTRSAGSGSWPRWPPSSDELMYAHHERGFALLSMRTPELSRLYLQCRAGRGRGRLGRRAHLGGAPGPARAARAGRSTRARSSRRASPACAASSSSRCSTAASTSPATPPTSSRRPGRRASTSPIADVRVLAEALVAWYGSGPRRGLLDAYSETCLRRVWRAEHFSWWMTSMLHRPGRRRLRPQAPAGAAPLRRDLARGGDLARRELRRAGAGLKVSTSLDTLSKNRWRNRPPFPACPPKWRTVRSPHRRTRRFPHERCGCALPELRRRRVGRRRRGRDGGDPQPGDRRDDRRGAAAARRPTSTAPSRRRSRPGPSGARRRPASARSCCSSSPT